MLLLILSMRLLVRDSSREPQDTCVKDNTTGGLDRFTHTCMSNYHALEEANFTSHGEYEFESVTSRHYYPHYLYVKDQEETHLSHEAATASHKSALVFSNVILDCRELSVAMSLHLREMAALSPSTEYYSESISGCWPSCPPPTPVSSAQRSASVGHASLPSQPPSSSDLTRQAYHPHHG